MNREDLIKVAKGAAIAAAGAALTYLADAASGGQLGPYGLAVAPILATAINALRKWLFPTDGGQ